MVFVDEVLSGTFIKANQYAKSKGMEITAGCDINAHYICWGSSNINEGIETTGVSGRNRIPDLKFGVEKTIQMIITSMGDAFEESCLLKMLKKSRTPW